MDISTLCTPVVIHIFLCLVYLLSYIYVIVNDSSHFKAATFIFDLLLNLLWIWFVYYLCSIGYIATAWLTIIIPFLMMFIMFIVYILATINSLSHPTQIHASLNPTITAIANA